ncbi:hypothetical protein CU254_41495 (plasmid) [Amycolatopsis sp. AA4]|uniref:hypothetical protein n=1 Tax=Actinomycetes TaxID=1760 RepID=UPI0001B556BC|nr:MULTISPECIES: hypothetical protein [Actinomycetes]ATY17062.1 hypothetical protein CU254_41495 [Amycolatopsis sp. AA4]
MSITTNAAFARRRPASIPVHLVGSLPPPLHRDIRAALAWPLVHCGDAPLTAMYYEPDPRWMVDWLDNLARIPALEQVRSGASQGYDDVPYYRIRPGHELDPADLAMGRIAQTEAVFAVLDTLDTGAVPRRLQVGIPNAFDRAVFASGSPEAADEWMPALQASVMDEVAALAARWGDRVQLQLESPAVLAAYHRAAHEDWPLLTAELVQQVSGIIEAAQDARWILHLCYGDLEHEPLFTPVDLDAAVQFLNALADALAERGIPMPTVHLPVAHGSAPPSTDPAFYRALLRLRRGIHVIAGVVAEDHPVESRHALVLITDALGGPVEGIAAGCGLGRRTLAAAAANMALAARLAHGRSPLSARRTA